MGDMVSTYQTGEWVGRIFEAIFLNPGSRWGWRTMPKPGGDESMPPKPKAPKPKVPFKSASSLELDEKEDRLMDGWLMHGFCWDGR